MKKHILLIIILALLGVAVLSGCTSEEEKAAIKEFDTAVNALNVANTELGTLMTEAESLINTAEQPLDSSTLTALETSVSEAKTIKKDAPERPKKFEDIIQATEEINAVDYTEITNRLAETKTAYENSVKQLKQVTAPTETFVIERVQAVSGVTGVSAATEENDPNGQLGKQGGYTAQIYFAYDKVSASAVSGNSIIEKGTDGGGSIEVYNTVEDAEKRDTYLASFDGGIFASGSHKILGTMVVRTSSKLTASQQKELETNITNSLIELK